MNNLIIITHMNKKMEIVLNQKKKIIKKKMMK